MPQIEETRERQERMKALDAAVGQIEKQFGKGSIMRLGANNTIAPVEVISTGAISIDYALGIGGAVTVGNAELRSDRGGHVLQDLRREDLPVLGELLDLLDRLFKHFHHALNSHGEVPVATAREHFA